MSRISAFSALTAICPSRCWETGFSPHSHRPVTQAVDRQPSPSARPIFMNVDIFVRSWTGSSSLLHDLHEQGFEVLKMPSAELAERPVLGKITRRQYPERHVLLELAGDLA